MSGLALALQAKGWVVSGSDARRSDRTERLEQAGIAVAYGHAAAHLGDAEWVVYSTDVPESNPERAAARERGLALYHRSQILAALIQDRQAICVTGTHGKTTTTSMIGVILRRAGLDPLVLVGGEVADLDGSNVFLGRGLWAVAEADESDGSFLRYHPHVAVVTNVEPEHLEHYGGRFENVVAAVEQFLGQVRPGGIAVLGAEDPVLAALAPGLNCPLVTFGAGGIVEAADIRVDPAGSSFAVHWEGRRLGEVRLARPGRHNIDNALAAVAAARHVGVEFAVIQEALAGFRGARRRFEEVLREGGIRVVDDYAVHPTEIRATLQAARQVTDGRVVAVWQPHRLARLQALWKEFLAVAGLADVLVVTDLYAPAGKTSAPGVDAEHWVAEAQRLHPNVRVVYAGGVPAAADVVAVLARPGDLIVTLGAGDVGRLAELLRGRLDRCAPCP